MVHSRIFIIPELLEQILHFLAIDKSLYPTLYVSRLWYRCGAPILWRRIELKGGEAEDRTRLERFLKIIPGGGRKPVYSSKLTHLKITHYSLLSNKKIKGIVHTFQNIIHLDFEGSTDCIGKTLKLIAKSYLNLEYLNISTSWGVRGKNDIGISAIANSCHKLKCLNISGHTEFSEVSICNVIRSCPRLRQLDLSFCEITDITIEEIVRSCLNLKYLKLEGCYKISKEAIDRLITLNQNIHVDNSVDPPAVIERVIELLSRGHTVATRVDSGADHPIIAINRQTPTQGIISTLMSRAVDRILADQAEWYSTDLTNPGW